MQPIVELGFFRVVRATLVCGALAAWPALARADAVDFNRQIRPILSANCFACHGPDAAQRQAELRLDTKSGALASRDGGAAISPGKPEASELLRRVSSSEVDEVMPPADSGKKLTAEEIDLVRRWIAEGAKWQKHWAYDAPARPPVGNDGRAADNPLDHFVRSRLRPAGLSPAPQADHRTLLRRLSFDLLGLPPTTDQLDAFLADSSADAYEKLVDRLLASPHFGERMAMYWLDVVRFADTNGYHGDNHREIALYRDYVIDAFNDNKPFDAFTVEQLAGDLLAGASRETRIASGYNHLLMTTREGGAQPKEYTAKYAADRVRNASVVWLGATLGCAECHDHKFDPYSTKDFYSFAAFFTDVKEIAVGVQKQVAMPEPRHTLHLARLDSKITALRTTMKTPTAALESAQVEWEASLASQLADWRPLKPSGAIAASGATLAIADDGSLLVGGAAAPTDVYTIVAPVNLSRLSAIRLEVLPHKDLPGKGPGRAAGNFVLSELRCRLAPKSNPAASNAVVLQEASAEFAEESRPPAAAIDKDPATGWAIGPKLGAPHAAVFEVQDTPAAKEAMLTIELQHSHGTGHTLGHFRLSATASGQPVRAGERLPKKVLDVLAVAPDARTPEQKQTLAAHYRTIAPLLAPVRERLAAAVKARDEFRKAIPKTLVAEASEPRQMRVLPRGNWLSDDGELVSPALPAFLPPLEVADRRATRLDLARWLTERDNPLVARVFVNRLWKLVFGQGIVRSLDDFGSQGSAPTHPELLDWLAVEFVESGWDVKHMLKVMVMSTTYRQSSTASEELRRRDPYNEYLARQSRFRLDAEMVRDNALAASGLLSPRIGGPSVKPYQPPGYWSHLNFPVREYQADSGESLYRRGLYTYWCRTFLHPSLLAFDAPTREECTVERPRSNTPLQALVLLNDPSYVEAARALAVRALSAGGNDTGARLQFAFRRVLSRDPRADEAEILIALFNKHRTEFAADPQAADRLLGETSGGETADRAERAAWTSVIRVLLNLHETITRA